jgi:hypothetical protein
MAAPPYKPVAKGSGLHKSGDVQSPAPPSKQICPPSKMKVSGNRKIGGKR